MLNLDSLPGVAEVVRISVPYKLVSREHRRERCGSIRVGGARIGPDTLRRHRRPVRGREPRADHGRRPVVQAAGAHFLRGGAFKPRTSPYAFQGMREDGLKILADARAETGLPVVTEVMDPRDVELVARYADVLQVGARNMQNFSLLEAVGAGRQAGDAQARPRRRPSRSC